MSLGDGDHEPGLEAGCVRPGLWLIESYDVERVRSNLWQVRFDGELRHETATLSACRDFIRRDRFKKDGDRDADNP